MTSIKTPQDFYNMATEFYKSVPKTATEVKATMEKLQSVAKTEFDNSREVMKTYTKAAKGDATANEIAKANKKAGELVKAATFASVLSVPGAIFMLPVIVEQAKKLNIDFVPASVAEQFNI